MSVDSVARDADETLKPVQLLPGDTIALIEIASPLRGDRTQKIETCSEALNNLGFKVHIASNFNKEVKEFVGSDAERAEALMECFLNPDIKMIWCLRGGYGTGRILSFLDFEKIKQHPKILLGMSDVTALHIALNSLNSVTFLGPLAADLFVPTKGEGSTFALDQVLDLLSSNQMMGKEWTDPSIETIQGGKAKGQLVGGNLTLIASMIGTPWQIQTKDNILILEDVGEKPYRVDRLLFQLKNSGLLENCAGVILGAWTDCGDVYPVLKEYFLSASYPVINGFPTGHISGQVTLPLSSTVELDADSKSVKLLEEYLKLS